MSKKSEKPVGVAEVDAVPEGGLGKTWGSAIEVPIEDVVTNSWIRGVEMGS